MTQQQPRHAFVTERHDAAYHLLVSSSYRPNFLPSVQIFFFPDGPGSVEKCVFLSLFHVEKRKRGKTTARAGRKRQGEHLREYAALKPTNMVEEPERGGIVFHSFLRRNLCPSHTLCTPCGHCRPSVTRSRDRVVTQRFFKLLSKRTHDS